MKKIGLFILSMLFTFGVMAQNVIVGTVKLKTDEQPIAGVSVTLGSTSQQVFTNEYGSFKLTSKNEGSDVLVFSGQGKFFLLK